MSNLENNLISYKSIISKTLILSKESWFNILSYLDLKSFLNLEKTSKFLRKIFLNYYFEKNTIEQDKENLKNKKSLIKKNNNTTYNNIIFPNLFCNEIKIYKKNVIEKYYNFLIQIPYTLAEFCGVYSKKTLTDLINNKILKINDFNCEINESLNCNSTLDYYNNEYSYKSYEFINNNKFMIFYNNTLNVYEININNVFEKKYSQFFSSQIILYFGIIQNSIFLIDNSGKLITMNPTNFATSLKRIRFYLPYKILKIFYVGKYFIFLTKENNLYYILFDEIFMKPKMEEELEQSQKELLSTLYPEEDNSIHKLFPIHIEKNYNEIIDINSNNNNFMMFIDSNYDIYGLYHGNLNNKENYEKKGKGKHKNSSKNNSRKESTIENQENEKEILSFYKINQGLKFQNYYTMSFGENFWILLEQNYKNPLIDWTMEEILDWFEKDIDFEEYLKVVKYQKVNGKNIVEGDKKYFKDILGMSSNKIKQLTNKEIKKVENGSVKNIKIWGYGNNRFGQLGLASTKYSKIPIKLEIPENDLKLNNDFIVKIICSNTISLLITKKEKIYICGNFNQKEKQNIIKIEDKSQEEKNENKNRKKGNKGKAHKKKEKEKIEKENEERNEQNLWVEISYEIKRIFTNNFYVKLKDIYIRDNILYIFGLKLNKKDFI